MINDLLANTVLWIAVACWAAAQVLKLILYSLHSRRLEIERLFGAGGMPSSHTSTVCGLTVAVARIYGLQSPLFTLSLVMACIVMYDATGVRRETGRQATIINQILKDVLINGKPISDAELKELVGHKPIEVAGGALVGLAVSGIYILALAGRG